MPYSVEAAHGREGSEQLVWHDIAGMAGSCRSIN